MIYRYIWIYRIIQISKGVEKEKEIKDFVKIDTPK